MPLRTALADTRLIAELLSLAETEAHAMGDSTPGAEHLLLAAVSLGDRSAATALGREADDVRAAIGTVHTTALATVGIDAPDVSAPTSAPLIYASTPSAREVFQRARVLAKTSSTGLRTAHVVIAVAELRGGTPSRVFDVLGVDRAHVIERATASVA